MSEGRTYWLERPPQPERPYGRRSPSSYLRQKAWLAEVWARFPEDVGDEREGETGWTKGSSSSKRGFLEDGGGSDDDDGP